MPFAPADDKAPAPAAPAPAAPVESGRKRKGKEKAGPSGVLSPPLKQAAPRRERSRKGKEKAPVEDDEILAPEASAAEASPRRRRLRKASEETAAPVEDEEILAPEASAAEPSPRRRRLKKASEATAAPVEDEEILSPEASAPSPSPLRRLKKTLEATAAPVEDDEILSPEASAPSPSPLRRLRKASEETDSPRQKRSKAERLKAELADLVDRPQGEPLPAAPGEEEGEAEEPPEGELPPVTPHYEEYLVDDQTRNRLQALFHVSHHDSKEFGTGADCHGQPPKGYYDFLEVECAWRIRPPAETVAAYDAFREAQSGGCQQPTELRAEYAQAVRQLLAHDGLQLDESANELLLLHGTKPDVVATILEKSLDPQMARSGIFGSGTYFAEHACKTDQYVHPDLEWKGGKRTKKYGSTCRLHNKIYPRPDLHPGNAHYALVCRVVLGNPFVTRRSVGQQPGYHSTLAELGQSPGDAIKRFREFVIFDKDAIRIEYLVCFRRVRRYCGCGDVLRERSSKDGSTVIACPNSWQRGGGWEGGCNLCSILPRCHCRDNRGDFWSATKDESEGVYYRCKKGRCGFRQLIDPGVDLRESDEDDEYVYDGWLVPDDDSGSGSGS